MDQPEIKVLRHSYRADDKSSFPGFQFLSTIFRLVLLRLIVSKGNSFGLKF